MKAWLLVAAGGGVGAVLRYQVTLWTLSAAQTARFPWGTLLVNLLGCLAVGLLWAWIERAGAWSEALRQALMIGLLGGFTTFSAFSLETFLMLKRGAVGHALAYVVLSLVLGGFAVWLGYFFAQARG